MSVRAAAPATLAAALVGREALALQLGELVAHPSPSYFLLGPPGSGKRAAAIAMAAALLCPEGGCGACTSCRSVASGTHPDLDIAQRRGSSLDVAEVREIVRRIHRTPESSRYRVVIVPEVHLAARSAPALLKSVEEPPPTTIAILTAEGIDHELEPLASRCIRVTLGRPSTEVVSAYLAANGVAPALAREMAQISGGRLDRALLFSSDEGIGRYVKLWRSVPVRLRDDPRALSELAAELEPAAPRKRSKEEGAAAEDRRERSDRVRLGLEVLLAACSSVSTGERSAGEVAGLPVRAVLDAVQRASSSLSRNVGIPLVLHELLFDLAAVI